MRALHPPFREPAFWSIQAMVVIWAVVHIQTDRHGVARETLPTGAPIDLLLIPVGYAALRYGLSGSAATVLWAALLWSPDVILAEDRSHPRQDLIQIGIVASVALFVGVEIERTRLARASAEAAEAEQRAAEIHYHRLFATNASPILLVDADGIVAEANPAALAVWRSTVGVSSGSLLGLEGQELLDGRSPGTLRLRTVRGEERDYRLSVSRLDDGGSRSLRQVVLEDVTEEYRSETDARAWAGEVLRAQEEERSRIAREIHDGPLQGLLQLARRMETIGPTRFAPDEPERIGAVRDDLLEVVSNLRDVTRTLRPAGLDQLGLAAAVRGLLADVEAEEGLAVELTVVGEVRRGTSEAEVSVFRIVQEAVRNVVRHAGATCVLVELAYETDSVRVVVADDGRGYDYDGVRLPAAGHLGILGMRERASLLDGRCDIVSRPGHGTVVTATIPLEPRLEALPAPGPARA